MICDMNKVRIALLSVIFLVLLLTSYKNAPIPAFAQNYEGSFHHKLIDTYGAWDLTFGNPDIVVAIIDSGIDFSHPDLANVNRWINTDEIINDSIDNDGNGYVDDVNGWDFASADNNPGPESGDPIHWHGTFIAGIITAPKDGTGVAGIAPNVTIMDVRILNRTNFFNNYENFGDAIRYAADNGADVISLSIYANQNSSLYYDDIAYAYSLNIPIVGITGNTFLPAGGQPIVKHPGASELVIAVGATNHRLEKADYSDYGEETELVAPVGDEDSVNIRSIAPPDQYWTGWGTSFAAPQVAATIALMKSVNASLAIGDIRDILHKSATDIGEKGKDNYTGYGLLNASKAVRAAIDPAILMPLDEGSSPFVTISPLSIVALVVIAIKRRKRRFK